MNASRLLEIVTRLRNEEEQTEIQGKITEVQQTLENLVNSPAEAKAQQRFSGAIGKLGSALQSARSSFQPVQIKALEEIGADKYFLHDYVHDINEWISQNPATPAVVRNYVNDIASSRAQFLSELEKIQEALRYFGVTIDGLEPGEAEIGFLLPRDLFDNELEKLIGELRVLRRVIRAFSEAATGSPEPIEVRQISTTDPLFFFGLDPVTIALLGGAVTWALSSWKKVEEIREIRAKTAKIPAFEGEPINEMFEGTIRKTLEGAVDTKVAELIEKIESSTERKNEQRTDLKWALEAILARIERGMTVEIRMLPPPRHENEEGHEIPTPQEFVDLKEISDHLMFPQMAGEPILKLTDGPSQDKAVHKSPPPKK